jgi:hypothetical protein
LQLQFTQIYSKKISIRRNKVNYWVATNYAFAVWRAQFITGQDEQGIQQILNFVREVIRAGEKEEVFRLLEIGQPYPIYHFDIDGLYVDFLKKHVQANSTIPLFELGTFIYPSSEGGQLRTPGKICYYTSEQEIAESEVENVGTLLRQLRPDDDEIVAGFMMPIAPLHISGRISQVGEKQRITVSISVHTDIWFPWVMGVLEEDYSAKSNQSRYDNRALATCHTPRLNHFLTRIRETTLELGGTWEIDTDAPSYMSMVTEMGISLEDMENFNRNC